MTSNKRHPSSFRDPSGYIFNKNGVVKRLIKPVYFKQYTSLKETGFFDKLFQNQLLIPHKEERSSATEIVLVPEQIPFITYPYEWSFLQYKEAALLTLKIQKFALEHGYTLKDASAFNVTFHNGQAMFIDTLSFDFYKDNEPWRAYKQFIGHFLGPLLLAHYHGSQSLNLLSNFIDGIPISMLSSMLPFKTRLNPFLYSNVHLLSKFEKKHNDDDHGDFKKQTHLSKKAQLNIVTALYGYIKKLTLSEHSEWGDYYNKTNYSHDAFTSKSSIINKWIKSLEPLTIIDVGGNDGKFIRQIGHNFTQALVCDIDSNAVDFNYKTAKVNHEKNIQPFVLDVLNPTADIGFNNEERASFIKRIKKFNPDVTMALAVIHHMTLTGNIPFNMSAQFFASFSRFLIIEFPTRKDSWVKRLLDVKRDFKDHFGFYDLDNFISGYSEFFEIQDQIPVDNSERIMFLLRRKDA